MALRCFKSYKKNDVRYPASKEDIMKACSGFSEISLNERDWFNLNIPDRTFERAEEVIMAIFDKILALTSNSFPCHQFPSTGMF